MPLLLHTLPTLYPHFLIIRHFKTHHKLSLRDYSIKYAAEIARDFGPGPDVNVAAAETNGVDTADEEDGENGDTGVDDSQDESAPVRRSSRRAKRRRRTTETSSQSPNRSLADATW